MNKRIIKSILISALVHILIIGLTTIIPFLLGASSLGFSDEEVELAVELAEEEDEEEDEEQEKKVIIDENTLNIDIVPKRLVKKRFNEELANEIIRRLNIKEEKKLKEEQEKEEEREKEINEASMGINVINTYPLRQHAKVILENFDFEQEFDAKITLRVNSDGSFRNIEVEKTSGKKIVDKSLENILSELSEQKIAFFTNFRGMDISFVSDTSTLTATIVAYFKDELNASTTNFLLKTVLKSAKENNKNDVETMTFLNNLSIVQEGSTLSLSVSADPLFVRDAIKD